MSLSQEKNISNNLLPLEAISQRILQIRGQTVLLDADLAALYGYRPAD